MTKFHATLTKTYDTDRVTGTTSYRHTVRFADGATICAESVVDDRAPYARPSPPVHMVDRQLQEQIVNVIREEIYRK